MKKEIGFLSTVREGKTSKMELVKREKFAGMEIDFYRNESNEVFMTRNQIGNALGYGNPQKAMDNIHARNKGRLDQFSVTLKLSGTDGKLYDTHLYNEKGIYEIMRKSNQPKADEFYDFVYGVIEGLRKGEIKLLAPDVKPQDQLLTLLTGVKFIADDLRVNDVSRLGMYRDAHEQFGLPTGHILPYVKSEGILKSATALIKENGSPMSVIKFNQRMVSKGLLEERTRPSSKGGIKKFKCLTDEGLAYGENLASPHNPKEVQPHYFDNRFVRLLEVLGE